MESSIISVLDSLINTDGVKGVLVTDKHGLCLGVRGIAKTLCSGYISSIANYAKLLNEEEEDEEERSITAKVETDNM